MTPQMEGERARHAGAARGENPYPRQRLAERTAWDNGWRAEDYRLAGKPPPAPARIPMAAILDDDDDDDDERPYDEDEQPRVVCDYWSERVIQSERYEDEDGDDRVSQ